MMKIKAGNYYTLADVAIRCGKTRQTILNLCKKLHIKPLVFGRLFTRYHEKDVKRIMASYGVRLPIDNSQI
jgi:hypothetical protein